VVGDVGDDAQDLRGRERRLARRRRLRQARGLHAAEEVRLLVDQRVERLEGQEVVGLGLRLPVLHLGLELVARSQEHDDGARGA